jgi:iron complex transport system substrate-binding protein
LSFLLFAACSAPQSPTQETANSLTITDDLGTKMTLKHAPRKTLALSPAMTEMLFAVCADSQILAVTPHCNFPAATQTKPKIAVYPLNIEAIIAAKPDIVFTEEGITAPDNAEKLRSLGIAVYYQRYENVADILRGLKDIGRLMQRETQAQKLCDSLEQKIKVLEQNIPAKKEKVLAITWHNPIYAYGLNTFMTDKIRLAGGQNAVDTIFAKIYPELTREYILKRNPDVLLGGSFGKMDSTFFMLYPELKKINAYKNKRIYDLNDDLTSRPSPRVLESVEEIRNVLQ